MARITSEFGFTPPCDNDDEIMRINVMETQPESDAFWMTVTCEDIEGVTLRVYSETHPRPIYQSAKLPREGFYNR